MKSARQYLLLCVAVAALAFSCVWLVPAPKFRNCVDIAGVTTIWMPVNNRNLSLH
jgi:hypothetical protein